MPKRKDPDTPSKEQSTPSKRQRSSVAKAKVQLDSVDHATIISPSKRLQTNGFNAVGTPSTKGAATVDQEGDADITPKPNGKTLFSTPSRRGRVPKDTPSRSAKADRSAKRKSAQALIDTQEDEDWDNSAALAREILDEGEKDDVQETTEQDAVTVEPDSAPVTPSKRGRPKGAKNKRSPTPEGDLPPEERYFFQNRAGPPRVSSNVFSTLGLLAHDEYFEQIRNYKDHHDSEKAYLMKLHTRSFPQWKFELDQGFSVCMYGYGSKRQLVHKFAEWLYPRIGATPRIVVLNGYVARINIRNVLNTIASALVSNEDEQLKLTGQPHDMLDTIFSHLDTEADTTTSSTRLIIMINSIDSASLRKPSVQSVLSRLAAHRQISLIATADTPTFPIMWNSTLRDQHRFVFHDCTTFAPYDLETNPVDDVHELLGRKNRRAGGRAGIGFVLKSLPENARNLYRVLLTEILTVVNDDDTLDGGGGGGYNNNNNHNNDDDDGVEERPHRGAAAATTAVNNNNAEEVGVEYRTLYQKALEEFICSSDMNFRFLLKEFHDHQMLTSRRDTSGTELLGVPLSKEEMEAVLEDLVLD